MNEPAAPAPPAAHAPAADPSGAGGGLHDVAGLRVGHAQDPRRPTGCTVVLCPPGCVAGVDVRGAAPGTRETELLSPLNTVAEVHALLLAGGSAFGLDAAGGVVRWLERRGIGIAVGPLRVPIVPAAILFDLGLGDPAVRPDAALGEAACEDAVARPPGTPAPEGNVGAGAGCSIGKLFGPTRAMRGGLGQAAQRWQGDTVAALAVVNAVGDVRDPRDGRLLAGSRSADGHRLEGCLAALRRGERPPTLVGAATTLAIVATDAPLDKAQATRLAQMAHDGLARAIEPVHTPFDGDTVFALATGAGPAGHRAAPRGVDPARLAVLGALAADSLAEAVVRAIRRAAPLRLGETVLPAACDGLPGPD
ncbi:P1 family peptidase [Piscinibacter sakaiensis]|uniref:Endo-type 6-aminohexanoate oligomer hydrolase n=1 Tax=Piscinibacter sakaiensis TaxID=1547922 RepID=A0A0K8NTA2_PISS1|nr:P1 family peptidase [Piscinibacter sakaiensis]GAP33646.1 endo-type 6-aminohexanoate oligomer hydrolase [Piscinibacter sakaiensis]